jgi:hypothetical protein
VPLCDNTQSSGCEILRDFKSCNEEVRKDLFKIPFNRRQPYHPSSIHHLWFSLKWHLRDVSMTLHLGDTVPRFPGTRTPWVFFLDLQAMTRSTDAGRVSAQMSNLEKR